MALIKKLTTASTGTQTEDIIVDDTKKFEDCGTQTDDNEKNTEHNQKERGNIFTLTLKQLATVRIDEKISE